MKTFRSNTNLTNPYRRRQTYYTHRGSGDLTGLPILLIATVAVLAVIVVLGLGWAVATP